MNQVNIFQSNLFKQEKQIEHILIGNDPWFKAKQVAEVLEYKNSRKAITDHVDQEDRKTLGELKGSNESFPPLNNEQYQQIMINESGIYSLVLRSRKKEAKAFKRWVTSEVLPSIRKQGYYDLNLKLSIQNDVILAQKRQIEEQQKEIDNFENKHLKLEAEYRASSGLLLRNLLKQHKLRKEED